MSDKLIVYYSRKNTTRATAEKLAGYLNCDITEIISKKKFQGLFGWLAAGRASMKEMAAEIIEPELKPENYEMIILCSPVWASNIPTPVRAWLTNNKGQLKKIAYLLTFSGGGADKVIKKMTQLGGSPIKTIGFSDSERKSGVWEDKLRAFANEL